MDYKEKPKKKDEYQGKIRGIRLKSNYIKPSHDPMTPYKKPSAPETQYSRNMKHKILRDEVSGPSGFLFQEYGYRNKQRPYVESGMTKTEINEIVQSSLKSALKERVESTGVKPVPNEVVEVAFDTANRVANSFYRNEVQQENETIGMNKLLEQNEIRQERVGEKTLEMNQAKTEEQFNSTSSEIKDINSEFFGQMDRLEPDTSRRELQKKRIDYDSEVGF